MLAFLKDIPDFLSFLVSFVFNFVSGIFNLAVHLVGNLLEMLLYLIPVEFIFFAALYLAWLKTIKTESEGLSSFQGFAKSNKWVKISFVALNIGVILVLSIKEGYLKGILLSVFDLYR